MVYVYILYVCLCGIVCMICECSMVSIYIYYVFFCCVFFFVCLFGVCVCVKEIEREREMVCMGYVCV